MPAAETKERITQSDEELHVGLEVPRHTARQIFLWAQDQDWPEGTELEQPGDYHVTLMYSPSGHDEHKDAWWLEHMEETDVSIAKFTSFPPHDGKHAYVLQLDAPEVKEHAEVLQHRAEAMGLEITHFDGGYKPHLTVGYGPTKVTGLKAPHFQFHVGPSSVSPPRPSESTLSRVAYDPDAEILDHLSMRSIAAQLHYRFEQTGSLNAQEAHDYAVRVLQLLGYPLDTITIQAAIQAWQTDYPDDKVIMETGQTQPLPERSDVSEKFAPDVHELSQSLGLNSTIPTPVNNPEDHWPEFGERPPDQKRDVQFGSDWIY